jgi:hypothetical protein
LAAWSRPIGPSSPTPIWTNKADSMNVTALINRAVRGQNGATAPPITYPTS